MRRSIPARASDCKFCKLHRRWDHEWLSYDNILGNSGMEPKVAHGLDQGRVPKTRTSPWPRYDAAALGFRNYWYPAMLSHKLRRRAVALQILGEKRSEEHTSELQSHSDLVCRLLLEKKKK